METIRGFRYRLYPAPEQAAALAQTAGVVRLVYNLALEQRQTWGPRRYGGHRHPMGAKGLSGELAALRREFLWIGAVSQTAQNQALLDLDRAYANFFAGRAGYPRPRKKHRDDTFRHVGREVAVRRLSHRWSEVKIPKIGWIRYRDSRPLAKIEGVGAIRNATLRRAAGGAWEISIACAVVLPEAATRNEAVGVDRGVAVPFALSTGETIHLPKTIAQRQASIRRAQKALSRRRRGSRRYGRTRQRLAVLRARDARARAHVAHQASTAIAQRFGLVAIEDLRIRAMTGSARGTLEEPGAGVRAKAGLNRAILNVGWHAFEAMLAYKLEAAGGVLMKVPPHHSSQTCSSCGVRDANSRKSQALFVCTGCGATHNADINAAQVILHRALAPDGDPTRRRNTPFLDVEGSAMAPCEASTVRSPAAPRHPPQSG